MIHAFGSPDPPVPRLLETLAARGHQVSQGPTSPPGSTPSSTTETAPHTTLVLGSGSRLEPMALAVLLGAWRKAPGARVLVVSALGAHPDARAPRLRELWKLEESARAAGLPVLTLRLGPLVGATSPFWLRLRSRPRLPRGGRQLLNPVAESEVVETLEAALRGQAAWQGWYEIAGPEAWSLAELATLAERAGPRLSRDAGAWEPPLAELDEHRLAEAEPWLVHFGVSPRPLSECALEWAA